MKASVIIFLLVLVSFMAQITKEDAISGTSKILIYREYFNIVGF